MSKFLELTKDVFSEKHVEKQADQIPYIGYSFAEDKVIYNINPNYLCLEPLEENNQLALFKLGEFSNIKYSFDKKNWNNFPVDSDNPFNINYITIDKPVYLRGYNLNGVVNMDELQGCKLTGSGKYNVSGDITTLLNIVGDVRDLTPYGTYGVFYGLFAKYDSVPCVDVVDASKLILPSTKLADWCYSNMFGNCTSLVAAPKILPATTLAAECYNSMFYNCTSLTTAPELPATTLANYCYSNMFQYCTSLTIAPKLPATELAESCYNSMFHGCTSLITAPELPATTLTKSCYNSMFYGCTNLNHIKCLTTDISADLSTYMWAEDVASTGTFIKHPAMTDWFIGGGGIPSGWKVENAVL